MPPLDTARTFFARSHPFYFLPLPLQPLERASCACACEIFVIGFTLLPWNTERCDSVEAILLCEGVDDITSARWKTSIFNWEWGGSASNSRSWVALEGRSGSFIVTEAGRGSLVFGLTAAIEFMRSLHQRWWPHGRWQYDSCSALTDRLCGPHIFSPYRSSLLLPF